jgi:LEA14-like dessication related protein
MAKTMLHRSPAFTRTWQRFCLLACAALLGGCAALQPYAESPRVSLVSIKPLNIEMLEQRYAIQLRILNPNSVELPVAGLSYALEINRREFAYGVSQQAVTIPPYGEALLEVEMVSSLLNVMRQLQQLDPSSEGGIAYRLHGSIGLSGRGARLPFDYSGELVYQQPGPAAAPEGG